MTCNDYEIIDEMHAPRECKVIFNNSDHVNQTIKKYILYDEVPGLHVPESIKTLRIEQLKKEFGK